MSKVIIIGFDKYVSDDINFVRLEDVNIENVKNWNPDEYACVIIRGDLLNATKCYQRAFSSATDFFINLPLEIVDIDEKNGFDMDEFNNYPWPGWFGFSTEDVSKDFMMEEIEIIALRYVSKKNQYQNIDLDINIKEYLELMVKKSEIRLKLAQKEHALNLIKLNKK